VDERRIVSVRDDDERPRRAFDRPDRREHGARQCGRLEDRGLDGDEDLQVDRVIAIGPFDRDTAVRERRVLDVRRRMRGEVRMHRGRVVIVVIRTDVRVQERRAHGAALNGERQPEGEDAADHAGILARNRMVLA
jgi:hypothetical protein